MRLPFFAMFTTTLLACGGTATIPPTPEPPSQPTPQPLLLQPQVTRFVHDCKTKPEAPGCDAAETLTRDRNAFALDLYQQLRSAPGNLVLSPFSVRDVLSMAYLGAAGETEKAFAKALHDNIGVAGVATAIHAEAKRVVVKNRRGEASYVLRLANRVWVDQDAALTPDYVTAVGKAFGADPAWVDFRHEPERSRDTINTWVNSETIGKVPGLMPPGSINASTRVALTNAVYFEAGWASEFDATLTKPLAFYLEGKPKVLVPTMSQVSKLGYAKVADAEVVHLNYDSGGARMVLIVPDSGGLEAFEAALTTLALEAMIAPQPSVLLDLQLPKFATQHATTLKPALTAMGLGIAFSDRADFSEMAPDQLKVSAVFHEAFVSIDEEGTEAVAASGATLVPISGVFQMKPVKVRINRPFMFVILSGKTGGILFMGRVLDPRGQPELESER